MAGNKRTGSALKRLAAGLLLFLSMLCAAPAEEGIKGAIRKYNYALSEAAKTGSVRMLYPYATEELITKTYVWIMSWQENNLYMQADLLSIDFKKIDTTQKNARVKTSEIWTYRYYDAQNRKTAWPDTRIFYEVEYRLFAHNGRWLIEKVTVLSERQEPL